MLYIFSLSVSTNRNQTYDQQIISQCPHLYASMLPSLLEMLFLALTMFSTYFSLSYFKYVKLNALHIFLVCQHQRESNIQSANYKSVPAPLHYHASFFIKKCYFWHPSIFYKVFNCLILYVSN
jgi:hypothetical protein